MIWWFILVAVVFCTVPVLCAVALSSRISREQEQRFAEHQPPQFEPPKKSRPIPPSEPTVPV